MRLVVCDLDTLCDPLALGDGVGVCEGVGDVVADILGLALTDGDVDKLGVSVKLALSVGVALAVGVCDCVGVWEGVADALGLALADGVSVGLGVRVSVALWDWESVPVGDSDGVGDAEGEPVGVAACDCVRDALWLSDAVPLAEELPVEVSDAVAERLGDVVALGDGVLDCDGLAVLLGDCVSEGVCDWPSAPRRTLDASSSKRRVVTLGPSLVRPRQREGDASNST